LIVEFANQLRMTGMSALEAVHKSATLRLRPILMTTGAMVLGAIPLALATGAGSESRQQIGWVIVGGMSLGTLLTIFVVPTMYSLFCPQGNAWADSNRLRRRRLGFNKNRLAFQVFQFLPCVGVGKRMAGIVRQVEIHS
jgi:multidrug efflux pump